MALTEIRIAAPANILRLVRRWNIDCITVCYWGFILVCYTLDWGDNTLIEELSKIISHIINSYRKTGYLKDSFNNWYWFIWWKQAWNAKEKREDYRYDSIDSFFFSSQQPSMNLPLSGFCLLQGSAGFELWFPNCWFHFTFSPPWFIRHYFPLPDLNHLENALFSCTQLGFVVLF